MVEVIRAKANLLLSHIEWETGCKEPIFGCCHPVYTWAIVHSSWLHNHFTVKSATTAYERACGRFYSGKVTMFGEAVMGFLRTSLKGLPQCTRGVWLSKALSNDSHIIGTPTGIFLTRSIRRLPTSFDLELLGELTASPWNCGCASLGHRLVHAKRVVHHLQLRLTTAFDCQTRMQRMFKSMPERTLLRMLTKVQFLLRRIIY